MQISVESFIESFILYHLKDATPRNCESSGSTLDSSRCVTDNYVLPNTNT